MNTIEWTEELSVNIGEIDAQHKSLLTKLNDVANAIDAHEGERAVSRTLSFLRDYTETHFRDEEKYMADAGFRGLAAQKLAHLEFISTLKTLERDFIEEGSTKQLAEAIDNFLHNWLINHIKGMDRKFGEYLAEKGISLP